MAVKTIVQRREETDDGIRRLQVLALAFARVDTDDRQMEVLLQEAINVKSARRLAIMTQNSPRLQQVGELFGQPGAEWILYRQPAHWPDLPYRVARDLYAAQMKLPSTLTVVLNPNLARYISQAL